MKGLTREEKRIEQAVVTGKYKPVLRVKRDRYQQAAAETMKKTARINIRMKSDDLNNIKKIADRKGMPYQTLVGSVLHCFANGDMISMDDAEQVEHFKEKLAV